MTKVVARSSNIRQLALCVPVLAWCAVMLAASGPATMFRCGPSHTAVLAAESVELGGLAWRFTTGGEVRSTPAVAEGLAVFGSNDGFLYAAEVKTGAEKWKVNLGGAVTSSPAIARGLVIVMGHDGRLQARKLADGSPVWTMATGPDLSLGDDPRMFDLWDSSPTVADDTVYVGAAMERCMRWIWKRAGNAGRTPPEVACVRARPWVKAPCTLAASTVASMRSLGPPVPRVGNTRQAMSCSHRQRWERA